MLNIFNTNKINKDKTNSLNKNNLTTTNKEVFTGWTNISELKSSKRYKQETQNLNNLTDNVKSDSVIIEGNFKVSVIKAKIYLKVKNREGRNKLIDNYISRVSSLLGVKSQEQEIENVAS